MSKILTVSVAAYNMEGYLEKCLSSLAVPEIEDDLEVFVIDDGGTDHSLEIAQAYARKYPDIFIPVHKENGGWGSTVNYSIEHATGKYFKVLDGDDWFDRDGLMKLVGKLKRSESDVIVTYYYEASPEKTYLKEIFVSTDDNGNLNEKVMENMPNLGLHVLCYKTDILRQSGLICPEHKLYCDAYFQIVPFVKVDTLESLRFPVCYYRKGREGQSVAVDTRVKHQDELIWICKDLVSFCSDAKARQERNYTYILRKVAGLYCTTMMVLRCNPVNRQSLAKIKDLDCFVRETSNSVYRYSSNHSGKFIWLMRKTHYLTYWLNKFANPTNKEKYL